MQQSFQGLGWADGEPGSGRHRGRRALEAGTRPGAALAELQNPPLVCLWSPAVPGAAAGTQPRGRGTSHGLSMIYPLLPPGVALCRGSSANSSARGGSGGMPGGISSWEGQLFQNLDFFSQRCLKV